MKAIDPREEIRCALHEAHERAHRERDATLGEISADPIERRERTELLVDEPSEPQIVVDEIVQEFDIKQIGAPEKMKHSRICYTLEVSFGGCFLDFSFTPKT